MPQRTQNGATSADAESRRPCQLGRRLLIMAYDAVAVLVLMMAVTALLLLTPLAQQKAVEDPLPTAILLFTWYLYLAWCWRRGGLTLGMRAWRARLVFEEPSPPGWGRCMLRFLVSLLSAAALGAGFLWSLFNPERKTWHDLASRSAMVRTSDRSDRSS